MKFIEPILFPVGVNPLNIFKFAGNNDIKKFDVLRNYGYQKDHYQMFYDYVDPNLIELLYNKLDFNDLEMKGFSYPHFYIEHIVEKFKGDVYEKYYKLILTTFILENQQERYNYQSFKDYLLKNHNFTFKKYFDYNIINKIDKYYNTIIFLDLWDSKFNSLYACINEMYGKLPISFNQEKVIKTSGEHLIPGGRIYNIYPENYGDVLFSLGDDFNIEDNYIVKKRSPKEPKTKQINWL